MYEFAPFRFAAYLLNRVIFLRDDKEHRCLSHNQKQQPWRARKKSS